MITAADDTITIPAPPVVLMHHVLLDQLAAVIDRLSDEQYRAGTLGAGSVGAHVRHTLDHYNALGAALATGRLDYDARCRGTDVETSRHAAGVGIAAARSTIDRITRSLGSMPLRMAAVVNPDGSSLELETTVIREVLFVLSHTVHHFAILASLIRAAGGWLPEGFGYAPSTLAYQRTCAPLA